MDEKNETAQEMMLRHRHEIAALEERERAAARAAMQRDREERAAAELLQNQANLDARVRALSPANLLAELAREGRSVRLLDDGRIAVTPAGLNVIHQKVLETRHDDVAALLRERERSQII
jgi:hypothetical protein